MKHQGLSVYDRFSLSHNFSCGFYRIIGADQSAEMTSYALAAYQKRLACFGVESDGLVTAVHARYIASAAAVAQVVIEYRE